jgi:hypothetical protein
MKTSLAGDMREAYRQRDLLCKKISNRTGQKSEEVRLTSHLMICLGDLTFIDLADIDMLKYAEIAKSLSSDFSGMTNTILSLSSFYKTHEL